jgi:hypothetical protein
MLRLYNNTLRNIVALLFAIYLCTVEAANVDCNALTIPSSDGSYWSSVAGCAPCIDAGCVYCLATFMCQDVSEECSVEDLIIESGSCPGR